MRVSAIDHVQLAMPPGEEARARQFYGEVLGLTEVPKPPVLAARGGVWFAEGPVQLHLGVEADFRPAIKAHPALRVDDLDALAARCNAAGHPVQFDPSLPGYRRFYVADPFGNRLEFLEPLVARECGCFAAPLPPQPHARELGMDARFAEVSVRICPTCGQPWLRYFQEVEAFTGSGRWFLGPITPTQAEEMTPAAAQAVLESLPWYFQGGTYFQGVEGRGSGPLPLTP